MGEPLDQATLSSAARKPLAVPSAAQAAASQLGDFIAHCERASGLRFNDYADFDRFCVQHYVEFWALFLEWSQLLCEGSAIPVVEGEHCESASFFPRLQLNYVENLLCRPGLDDALPALTAVHLDRPAERWTRAQLRAQVQNCAAALAQLGLVAGDRVALLSSNTGTGLVWALGAAALGCTLSTVAPEMGTFAVTSRLAPVKPVLLLAELPDPASAAGRQQRARLPELVQQLPSLRQLVLLDPWDAPAGLAITAHRGAALLAAHADAKAAWPRLPFNHPLFILFTSGTTGAPKCLVHGAGGTLIEHVKEHRLHCDLRAGDKLFFQTSTSWMMWNWQLSALAGGVEIVVYDGPVTGPERLWQIVSEQRVTAFGTSPAYLQLCEQSGWQPDASFDFTPLRALFSTGSVLYPRQQDWAWRHIRQLPIQSISGGTDIVGCFVLGNPQLPVYSAECQSRSIGLDVRAWGSTPQQPLGELVCANPFPSRPLGLLDDRDGSRFHAAYFSQHAGLWTHGDLIEFTPEGSARMHGRCDGVLNIRGIRIGPAEIYRMLQDVPQIVDVMAVEQATADEPGGARLVLLVVLRAGCTLDCELDARIKRELGHRGSAAHVPAAILAVDELPTTHSGKRSERAARDALSGRGAANLAALRNPDSLAPLTAFAAQGAGISVAVAATTAVSLQEQVTRIWEAALGLSPVRPGDNYFDLGGDSLKALGIIAELKRCLGREVPLTLLFEAPTVQDFCATLQRPQAPAYRPLVLLQPGPVEATPLFVVHGVGGSAMELLPLARKLGAERPVYALQGRGFDASDNPHADLRAMAEEYLQAVRQHQPQGPYLLAGYSFGGLVAYEMARCLTASGERVAQLLLLDTSVPELHWPMAAWREYFFRRLRLGLRQLASQGPRQWLQQCLSLARALAERLRRRRLGPELLAAELDGVHDQLPEQVLRVRRAGFSAALAEAPQPSSIDVTLFRSELAASHGCDPALVWRRLVPSLCVCDVPGTHASMIRAPHADALASRVGQRLRELELQRLSAAA